MLKVYKRTTCDVWSEVNLKRNVLLNGGSLNSSISMCCQMVVQGRWENIVQAFFSRQFRRITLNFYAWTHIKIVLNKIPKIPNRILIEKLVTCLVLAFKLMLVITLCFPSKDWIIIYQWINVDTSIPETTVTLWSYCKHSLLKSIEAKPSWTGWLGKVQCCITDLIALLLLKEY